MLTTDFRGVMCPLVTPFVDGDVDADGLVSLVDWLIEQGVDGLVPCGTTGEFASLSPAEYRTVVETTVEAAAGRVPVVPGVAATDVETVCSRVEFAGELDAEGALLPPPYFHPAPRPTGTRRFFESVADESSLPLLIYNIPACTSGTVASETVAKLSEHEAIVGLKDTSGDFDYFLDVSRKTPQPFLHLQGYDKLLASSVHAGADGGISALSNVLPEVIVDIAARALRGETDEALRQEQSTVPALFGLCLDHGFATVAKAGLVSRGIIDSASVRPPLLPLPDDVREGVPSLVASSIPEKALRGSEPR